MTKPKIEYVDFDNLRENLSKYARITLKILDKSLSDDLIQDTMLVIIQKFENFDGKSINAWAQRILHIEYYKYISGCAREIKKANGYASLDKHVFLHDEKFLPLVMSILNSDEQEYIMAKYIDRLSIEQMKSKMSMSKTCLHTFGVKIMEKLRKSKLLQDYNLEK